MSSAKSLARTTGLILWISVALTQMAMAAPVRTAPFSASRQSMLCLPASSEFCIVSSNADRMTGVLTVSAERRSPALSNEHGVAQAQADIRETVKPPRRTRSVQAWVTFRLDSASASTVSAGDFVRVDSTPVLRVECTCPDGERTATSTRILADTDPGTPSPQAREGVDFVVALTVQLEPGESVGRSVFLDVRLVGQATLQPSLYAVDRDGVGTGQITVQTIEFKFSQ